MADGEAQANGSGGERDARWWVYIVQCADGTLYTGISNDVDRRIAAHNAGKGAKYTRPRLPVVELYREPCEDKSASLRRELEVKALSRVEKLALVKHAHKS